MMSVIGVLEQNVRAKHARVECPLGRESVFFFFFFKELERAPFQVLFYALPLTTFPIYKLYATFYGHFIIVFAGEILRHFSKPVVVMPLLWQEV